MHVYMLYGYIYDYKYLKTEMPVGRENRAEGAKLVL